MLVYLASIIQHNLFSISHLVFFMRLASFLLVSAFQLRSDLRDLRPLLILHIAHSHSHTSSLYDNRPHSDSCRSLPREIASLRNDFKSPDFDQTLSAMDNSFGWLRRSMSDSCFLPLQQVLFMYPTVTGFTSRSHIQTLLHFVFISIP